MCQLCREVPTLNLQESSDKQKMFGISFFGVRPLFQTLRTRFGGANCQSRPSLCINGEVTNQEPLSSEPLRVSLLALLFAVSFASYMERSNLSIAAELMMPALSLTKRDLAILFNGFLVGYAIFQVPTGWLGDRFSPRVVLGTSVLLWGVLTVLTGSLPGRLLRTAGGTVAILWLLRFLLGAAEASTFPVASRAVHLWIGTSRRGLGNSLMLTGASAASAFTASFVSWSMLRFGWRASFYLTAVFALVVSVLWFLFHPPRPAAADAEAGTPAPAGTGTWLNTNVILLSLSYVSEGYLLFMFVSWLYIYLVEVRGFSLQNGGFVASLPWIAAIGATPLGGFVSDRLTARHGTARGARMLIMTGYTLSGVLLLAAALAPGRTLAVAALCISLGSLYLAESSFWAMATSLAKGNAGAVAGFMNTIGILGGIASNAAVPLLVAHFGPRGWIIAFSTGTAMGFFCSGIWLFFGKRLESFDNPGIPVTLESR